MKDEELKQVKTFYYEQIKRETKVIFLHQNKKRREPVKNVTLEL